MKKIMLVVTVCMLALGWAPSGMAQLVGSGEVSVKDKDVVKAAQAAVKARQEALNAEGKTDTFTAVKIVKASRRVVPYEFYDLELQVKVGETIEAAKVGVYRGYSAQYEMNYWNDEHFDLKEEGKTELKEISVTDPDAIKAAQFAIKARQAELRAVGKSAMITISKIMAAQQRASLPYPVYDFHFMVKVGSEEREAYATVARWSTGEYELISWTD